MRDKKFLVVGATGHVGSKVASPSTGIMFAPLGFVVNFQPRQMTLVDDPVAKHAAANTPRQADHTKYRTQEPVMKIYNVPRSCLAVRMIDEQLAAVPRS